MARRTEIPKFGVLEGLRVLFSGGSIAAPFSASLMADMGADVIWMEHYAIPDIQRTGTSYGYLAEQDRKNMRNITLNVSTVSGKEVFLKLVREADIFIEGSRGRTWDKFGLDDDTLWAVNPKLSIVHISGFGQYGVDDFVTRGSYDPIGQAYGGLMCINEDSRGKALMANGSIGDYYSAFMAAFSGLSGYINAQKTGRGESFDISQFEACLRNQNHQNLDCWNQNHPYNASADPDRNMGTAAWNSFVCKDGQQIHMLALGVGVMNGLRKCLGVGFDVIPEGVGILFVDGRVPAGDKMDGHKLEDVVRAWCLERTAMEVETEMNNFGVPCAQVLNFDTMLEHPHFLARETLTTVETVEGRNVIISNIVPKCKRNPGRIWCPAPDRGQDNEDILADLGYSPEQIKAMYADSTVTKPAKPKIPCEVRKFWGDERINPDEVAKF